MNYNEEIIEALGPGELLKLKKNSCLLHENSEMPGLYIVKKGVLKITRSYGNTDFILWLAEAEEFIGLDALVAGSPFRFSCTALQDCELIFITTDEFQTKLNKNEKLRVNILHYLSAKSDSLEERIAKMNSRSLLNNFARLLEEFNRKNLTLLVPNSITTSDIAHLIGTTKNYVYKLIQQLENMNIISFKERKLRIINKELLKQLVNENAHP